MAHKNPEFFKHLLFFAIYSALLILFTIGLDRAIVSRFSERQFNDGLIFKPFTRIRFQGIEYKYEVYVNNYGFRDAESPKKAKPKYRIMALGDSFTYGWGVEIEESWPRVLEKVLNEQGMKVEVDNLGKPGAGPKEYAEIAEKAIPVLKPDLVIVGMLQGDDLAQSRPGQEGSGSKDEGKPESLRHKLAGDISFIYPYSSSLIVKKFSPVITSESIHQAWKAQAEASYARFSPVQKSRFQELDDEVKRLFFSGELNPAVIYIAITNPDYYLELEDMESEITNSRLQEMAKELGRIKKAADQYNSKVILVSIPHRIYVSESDFNTPRRFGFNLDPEMIATDSMDQALEMAGKMNGLEFYQFTGRFRIASQKSRLFFALDGHLNASGQGLLAELMAPVIKQKLE